MRTSPTLPFVALALLSACSSHPGDHAGSPSPPPYGGQQRQEIKSLSPADIEQLSAGKGWGFAKAAELNGVPGPLHLLELADELELPAGQRVEVRRIYDSMHARAAALGRRFVEDERKLSQAFANRVPTREELRSLVANSARTREELRLVHLEAHLATVAVIDDEVRRRYVEARGYGSADPCDNPPPGHDPEMWRRHNDCPPAATP